ncbi:hypothetical protein COS64_00825 [archaeon CG06_land_8_20_14_3_00_37_11]|nr:MAG: hypothetical protein COS64_00825 [archaeon CG06_land_8_20_14_3_00_37_11]
MYNKNNPIYIEDLVDISEEIKQCTTDCLEKLMTFEDGNHLIPIISGYNFYTKTIAQSDIFIYFSHIHETEKYKKNVIKSLKKKNYINETEFREKSGKFIPDINKFKIRDDKKRIYPYLRIKDTRTGDYINLNNYYKPLGMYKEFEDAQGYLISEDHGWELNMTIDSKEKMFDIIDMFKLKSSSHVIKKNKYTKNWKKWRDAYRTPVLILSKKALEYKDELFDDFIPSIKMYLTCKNNEISFIINEKMEYLERLPQLDILIKLGFKKENCLANKVFIKEYVDNLPKRNIIKRLIE